MEKMMTATMGRGEFLRAALLLVGGSLLDLTILRGQARAAEIPPARTDGKTMEKKRIRIYSTALGG